MRYEDRGCKGMKTGENMGAYKCDRCGALYEREYTHRRCIEITHDLHPYETVILKLCDKCQNELLSWLEPYTKGKRNIT